MGADKDEIKDRSDIVDVIGSYVPLKRRGRNFVGLCPFHSEKTPSFNVQPVTRTFTCFGCGAKGDVFTFIEQFENMSFMESAEFLARRAGLEFDREGAGTQGERSERERIYEVNRLAMEWFEANLQKSDVAKKYLYEARGLTLEIVSQFHVGYAPDFWEALRAYLVTRKMDLNLSLTAGLLKAREDGSMYDAFRHRIMFPILDEQERVVGFGGRAFGDDQPKYLNTGETPVFIKSRLLYGLPLARRKIASDGRVLLMEGYMDVIAAHQAGFTNSVATLGTSLTEDHAKKLARLVPENPRVVLVYDSDAAGIKATLKGSEVLEKEGVNVFAVSLPTGDDPDSMLKRGDIAGFQRAVDHAPERIEHLLRYAKSRHDLETVTGRENFLRDAYRILAQVESLTVIDRYLSNLVEYHPLARFGVPTAVSEMRKELADRRRKEPKSRDKSTSPDGGKKFSRAPYRPGMPPESLAEKLKRTGDNLIPTGGNRGALTPEEKSERLLIRAALDLSFRSQALELIEDDLISTPALRGILQVVRESGEADESQISRIIESHEDEEFAAEAMRMLQELQFDSDEGPILLPILKECKKRLKVGRNQRIKNELSTLLAQPTLSESDRDRVNELHNLYRALKGSSARTS